MHGQQNVKKKYLFLEGWRGQKIDLHTRKGKRGTVYVSVIWTQVARGI